MLFLLSNRISCNNLFIPHSNSTRVTWLNQLNFINRLWLVINFISQLKEPWKTDQRSATDKEKEKEKFKNSRVHRHMQRQLCVNSHIHQTAKASHDLGKINQIPSFNTYTSILWLSLHCFLILFFSASSSSSITNICQRPNDKKTIFPSSKPVSNHILNMGL